MRKLLSVTRDASINTIVLPTMRAAPPEYGYTTSAAMGCATAIVTSIVSFDPKPPEMARSVVMPLNAFWQP